MWHVPSGSISFSMQKFPLKRLNKNWLRLVCKIKKKFVKLTSITTRDASKEFYYAFEQFKHFVIEYSRREMVDSVLSLFSNMDIQSSSSNDCVSVPVLIRPSFKVLFTCNNDAYPLLNTNLTNTHFVLDFYTNAFSKVSGFARWTRIRVTVVK